MAVKARKTIKKTEIKEAATSKRKPEKYFEAVGRRKTAIARVRISTRLENSFLVNGKPLQGYFPTLELQRVAKEAQVLMDCLDKFGVEVRVRGGGFHAQAEAVRHGLSRALVKFSPDFRKRLKKAGFLKRDPRAKERKKPGLKRARRAPQWAKR